MATHEVQSVDAPQTDLGRYWPFAAVIAVIGALLFFVMGYGPVGSDLMYGSYMFGLIFWLSITLGCFGLSLLHHATRATWSSALIRLFEAGGGAVALTVMGVLLLPVVIPMVIGGLPHLYSWTAPGAASDWVIQHKRGYLNVPFWTLRLALYFCLWLFWSSKMRRSTLKQDETKNFRLEMVRHSWGAAGIVMFFLTATFAFIDLVMSMDPHWYSTMYGTWVCVSTGYAALALCVFVICSNSDKAPFNRIIYPDLTKDFGNMMFVMTMLWGYTTLTQFIIIWNGNLPETTTFFTARSSATHPPGMEANNWGLVGFFLIMGMFFVPFYTLLAPRTKRFASNLRKVALGQFLMSILNMYMIVVPSLPGRAAQGPLSMGLITDLLALIAIGGLWFAVFFAMSRKASLLPLYDPRLEENAQSAH